MEAAIIWIALIIIFAVVEIITVGLTSIWFAGGAVVALLVDAAGLGPVWQFAAFVVVSVILLVFTRPFAMRFINTRRLKTNYEGIIGKTIRISQKVDNIGQTGMAVVNGTEWTVRSEQDDVILDPGTLAKVVNISGVKLIVKKYEED